MTVTLNWTNNSISATSFPGSCSSSDNGTTWGTIGTAAPGASTSVSYTDTTASEGATYTYRVAAVNAAGSSTYVSSPSVTIAPAAPSGLSAITASSTVVVLSWTNVSQGQTGIFIERSLSGGSVWTPVITTGASADSYPDTGLTPGTTYNYRISAVNAGGASSYSTATGVTAPGRPGHGHGNHGFHQRNRSELAGGQRRDGLHRFADGTGNSGTPTVFRSPTSTMLADTALTEGTQYSYTVTAVDAGGASVAAGPVSATTLPAAPSNAAASGVSAGSVLITWTNNSQGATAFIVQRSGNGGTTWTNVAPPSGTQTSIIDQTASEATTYIYQVIAVDGANGQSSPAVTSPVTTVPLRPTNLSAATASSSSILLTWTNNSQGASLNTIQRGTDGQNFTTIGTVSGTTATFTDTQASAATDYFYRIFATGTGGASDFSNVSDATTTPGIPQNVVATAASATVVGLTWNAVTGATSYNILRSTDNVTFSSPQTSSTNSYSDTSASRRHAVLV